MLNKIKVMAVRMLAFFFDSQYQSMAIAYQHASRLVDGAAITPPPQNLSHTPVDSGENLSSRSLGPGDGHLAAR